MPDAISVLIPLINPNEIDALLARLHVEEGEHVVKGDLLCTLETTKSTAEVAAEQTGYVMGLTFSEGQTVSAGDLFCYLANSEDWRPPEPRDSNNGPGGAGQTEGLRITQPALNLAQDKGLDVSKLPRGPLVTEERVRSLLAETDINLRAAKASDSNQFIVYGGGGHGKACIELLHAVGGYEITGVVDDDLSPEESIWELPILGGYDALPTLYEQGTHLAVNAVGGIGDIRSRTQVFRKLVAAGFAFPTLVHSSAVVEASVKTSAGIQVFPLAYIGSDAQIGQGVIINTGAVVSHDCQVGEFSNISPGAILAGNVKIGARSLVGMGATINLNVLVGDQVRIGNGATIKTDVPDGGIVPAGAVWPR